MCEAIYTYAIEKHNFMVDLNLPKLIEQSIHLRFSHGSAKWTGITNQQAEMINST